MRRGRLRILLRLLAGGQIDGSDVLVVLLRRLGEDLGLPDYVLQVIHLFDRVDRVLHRLHDVGVARLPRRVISRAPLAHALIARSKDISIVDAPMALLLPTRYFVLLALLEGFVDNDTCRLVQLWH